METAYGRNYNKLLPGSFMSQIQINSALGNMQQRGARPCCAALVKRKKTRVHVKICAYINHDSVFNDSNGFTSFKIMFRSRGS